LTIIPKFIEQSYVSITLFPHMQLAWYS